MRLHSKWSLKQNKDHVVELVDIQRSRGKGNTVAETVIYSKHKRPFSLDKETFEKLYDQVSAS